MTQQGSQPGASVICNLLEWNIFQHIPPGYQSPKNVPIAIDPTPKTTGHHLSFPSSADHVGKNLKILCKDLTRARFIQV